MAIRAILVKKGEVSMQVNTTDFKNHLGEYLDMAKEQPVIVRKSGKPIAVVLDAGEYEYLQGLEDLYWAARAEAAEASGAWVTHEEAVRLLTARLKQAR